VLVHLLFGTPFLVLLALWGVCLVLYSLLLETRLKGKLAPRIVWKGLPGPRWQWLLAYWGGFVAVFGALMVAANVIDSVHPKSNSGWMFIFLWALVWQPYNAIERRHNRAVAPPAPASWIADVDQPEVERYWDGAKWTGLSRDVRTRTVTGPIPNSTLADVPKEPPRVEG
jgi:hypothetical protein